MKDKAKTVQEIRQLYLFTFLFSQLSSQWWMKTLLENDDY